MEEGGEADCVLVFVSCLVLLSSFVFPSLSDYTVNDVGQCPGDGAKKDRRARLRPLLILHCIPRRSPFPSLGAILISALAIDGGGLKASHI